MGATCQFQRCIHVLSASSCRAIIEPHFPSDLRSKPPSLTLGDQDIFGRVLEKRKVNLCGRVIQEMERGIYLLLLRSAEAFSFSYCFDWERDFVAGGIVEHRFQLG